ncbi:MAG: PQQ-binding-like beta-propeller repeat protein [Planctomycetota bacterium]|nr:PQQ-binding-like beta-propeller repeat protein [Planctomycetota bacterium]
MSTSMPCTRLLRILPGLLPGLLLVAAGVLPGCIEYKIKKKPRPETVHLEVRHEAHGTSHATAVYCDLWYVVQGNRLLVLDPLTGRQISELDLMPSGLAGPAVDLLVEPTVMYVVLRDTEVISLDRTDARRPWVESRWGAEALGIVPRAIDPGRDGPIISGLGGSVQLPSLERLVDHHDEVTSVVELDDESIYTSGRRAYRVGDDSYLGSATSLSRFPVVGHGGSPSAAGSVLPVNTLLFIRNEISGGLGGFAVIDNGMLRELDSRKSTEALSGGVQCIRVLGDRILMAGTRSIHLFRIDSEGALRETWSQDIGGIRDADFLDENKIVIVGEFGQACFRTDRHGNALVFRHDAPGGLLQAISDGRTIMATGVDGTWEYQIGDKATLVNDQPRLYPPAPRTVALLGWEIKLAADGSHAIVSNTVGQASLVAPIGSRFTTVAAGDGAFWLGHEQGVMMLKPPKQTPMLPMGWDEMTEQERMASGYSPLEGVQKLTVEIDGPVIFIEPLDLGGGVAYAAHNGGFGVIRESW